ncbi:Na+/H+ antiporter NhaA [Pedobacter sp. BS3]|uniref:Na+/H+ antiporter NhaA n=1 Tax=Pedobacter sp. BS3 TaxID=2567937 RepID=UPI0011ED747C|nr:Na+/H+ antiporter NhaA [Pedobacter sp. BS3]TZF84005.1 Na+/H+ antiporter NhaA [Pedobacter sp. BS3]
MSKLINLQAFKDFAQSGQFGGFLLIGCVIISLLIANSPLADGFMQLLNTTIGFDTSSLHLNYSISLWINDGLMAVFFLLVGLEIKRELLEGELSSPAKAAMPVFAAVGGMIVPALIFLLFNYNKPTHDGWGIPMATDIAFALAVVSLLGNKVPASLKVFMAALAIVDDLGAILVIAAFYTNELHFNYLIYAGLVVLLLIILNKTGVKNLVFYLIPGIFLWYFIHHSGIHATISGVLLAFTIPTNETDEPSPLENLEHLLHKPVNYMIMPLFALANTNIRFEKAMLSGITHPIGLGIIFGLILGKPIGITLFSWLSVKLNLSTLPDEANWKHITGIGIMAGIGFTMSIFISLLSFNNELLQSEAKFSILIASVIAGTAGFIYLRTLRTHP